MGHTYSSLYFHVIWSTKDRKPIIKTSFRNKLYSYIGGIIKKEKTDLLSIGGISNHIHILIKTNTQNKISDLIQKIKGGSSAFINQTLPNEKFNWQSGYGIFAVSISKVDTVKQYIVNQELHHKKISYENEFEKLLDKHKIKYKKDFLFQ